ncbi:P13 family porin (plasmid) [Borreliella tanukii]|uniref:P13 family porin n=1 Tax=Borreliella tanukii TaxID=56146 RepID=UPI003AEFBDCB
MKKIFTLILIFSFLSNLDANMDRKTKKEIKNNNAYSEKYLSSVSFTPESEIGYYSGYYSPYPYIYPRYHHTYDPELMAFFLNMLIPLGIGSFSQGDYIGGGSVLGFSLLGTALIITGFFNMPEHDIKDKTKRMPGYILMGTGALTLLTSYITSLIIPFTFANKDKQDKQDKEIGKKLGIFLAGFEPSFDIGINGFQLSFKKVIK